MNPRPLPSVVGGGTVAAEVDLMSGTILTEVSATVAPDRESDLLTGFRELLAAPLPDGLVRTELLHAPDGDWRIHSLWRDRQALDAMRAGPEPPAAPQLFRKVGAEPSLRVYEVEEQRVAATSTD